MNNTDKRADRTKVTDILNRKTTRGVPIIPDGKTALDKEVERYTISCPECGEDGRYDDEGDIICDAEDCFVVITDSGEMHYSDKYTAGAANDAAHGNRGASGHPNLRTPALRPAGPSGDDSLAN